MDLASLIDHTALKPIVAASEVSQLCTEAIRWHFAAVCVPPFFVRLAAEALSGSGVAISTVIGFPMGYSTTATKEAEAREAIAAGATELDVVQNLSALKSGDWRTLETEAGLLLSLCRGHGVLLKIILETGVLTEDEILRCCRMYGALGIDFAKTSTGFNGEGASPEVVRLMRAALPPHTGIKASGGIRTFAAAQALVEAGATRIGTSSGPAIVTGG